MGTQNCNTLTQSEGFNMPKAVISNRIYLDLPEDKQKLFDALTYKIVTNAGHVKYENIEIIRNYRMVTPSIVSIPQGREDLIPSNYQVIDKRVEIWEEFPKAIHSLFDEQKVIYDQVDNSCFINALVGWGNRFALSLSN